MDIGLDQAKELLDKGVQEAEGIIGNPSRVDEILQQAEEKLMVSMVKAWITKKYTVVSPKVIACLVGAFIYLIKKQDLVSDSIPIVGHVDDLAVLGLALKLSEPELKAYAAWRDGTAGEASL